MKAKITIDIKNIRNKIDSRLYGSFIEHLGRAVYGGIYEKGKLANEDGFRKDIIELIKDMDVPIIRYPGGNFVSGFEWEDSVGPKEKRPKKMELAWKSIETNEVGICEFQKWAKEVNSSVMMAVNLGTRGAVEARNLLEYCNGNTDTYYANLRRSHGYEQPFDIKVWCLGNEMDGPWQIGAKKPYEYARIAVETAKLMKWTDDKIELVACGSSHPFMETFGLWERTLLKEAYDYIDYLSLHHYFGNYDNNTKKYLASSISMGNFIDEVVSICDEIKEEKKSDKTIYLSFDEWNVWYHSNDQDKEIEPWQIAPPLLEDIYNLEDALVVGTLINTLINHSDRVKIAALAQLVNVIAPIMTNKDGYFLQTIFYPFYYASKFGRGSVIIPQIECETYDVLKENIEELNKVEVSKELVKEGNVKKDNKEDDNESNKESNNEIKFFEKGLDNVPYLDASVVISDDKKSISLFAVNRSLDEDIILEIDLLNVDINGVDVSNYIITEHIELTGDIKSENSFDNPENVVPVKKEILDDKIIISSKSWNLIRMELD